MRRWSYLLLTLVLLVNLAEARTWRVPADVPTIQAGIDSAQAGDDVLVAPGTYREHTIEIREAIWVHSESGPASAIVDGEGLGSVFDIVDVTDGCKVEGFTIRGGNNDEGGGGVACRGSLVTIRDCIIESCEAFSGGGGILVLDSNALVDGCTIADNDAAIGGGVAATGDASTSLTVLNSQIVRNDAYSGPGGGISSTRETVVRDCLFVGNGETHGGPSALYLGDGPAAIAGCTFVNNDSWGGDGPAIGSVGIGTIDVERCVVAFNGGSGIRILYPGSSVSCTTTYGNTGGQGSWAVDGGGNFSADPLFCDLEGDDYTLLDESPCLPGQHPDGVDCGLIGALGVGCGVTPTLDTSWGQIKGRYR